MVEINLRHFYPWYMKDCLVEVSDEVAAEFRANRLYEAAHQRRPGRNKAAYSLDMEDGIEYTASFMEPSTQELIERMEQFEQLCCALNALPDAQGRRVFEHFLLGRSQTEIAADEGVSVKTVHISIRRGLESMKNFLKKFDREG